MAQDREDLENRVRAELLSYGNVLSLPSPASAGMGWWITTTLTDGIAAPVDSGFRVWAHEFYEPGRKRWRGEEEPDTRLSRMEPSGCRNTS